MTPTANTFEDRLLDALLDRFDAQSHQPQAVLAPVARRSRVRRYAIPVGSLAAAAAATSVILELGGPAPAKHVETTTPPYALAAWTTHPTTADPAQLSAAEARCSTSLNQGRAGQSPTTPKQSPPQAGGPWTPALVDTRANLTLALYTDGPHWLACLAGPSFISVSDVDAASPPAVAASSARVDKVSTRAVSGDLYTVVVGRTGSAVTGVSLRRLDGSVVTATVGNGRFIAWWPEGAGIAALSVTTNGGSQSYPVDPRFGRLGPQPTNKAEGRSSNPSNNKVR